MAKNERNTENLVRDRLRELGFADAANTVQIEEQKSNIEAVRRLLKAASKAGGKGVGAPEFIISCPDDPDILIVIECKASPKDHESPSVLQIINGFAPVETPDQRAKRVQRYAADGALHYASSLAKEFNVIAVAVSGETKSSLSISSYIHTKGSTAPKRLTTPEGATVDTIVPWNDYVRHALFNPAVQRVRFDELMAFSRELHDFMRDHAKLTESEKPLLVSGTLIALRNAAFAKAFDEYPPDELQKQWMHVIREEIQKADIPRAKKDNMAQPYSSIAVHPELSKATKFYPKGVLHELIKMLKEKVWPFISLYHDFDVVGQFYGEFLKYTGGDKKALGIVLTPRHITELFALLANVNKDSRVLDICAGTGGFLISAMKEMMRTAVTEEDKESIKAEGLVGVEQQPNMFALAASNMILRGDGKANLHQGSCFDEAITAAIKAHGCNVGLLNPPFSQGDEALHELYFVKHMLDCLEKNGVGIAITPISCAIAPHAAKAELLKAHTLEAVMSLPNELFSPVGTVTCAMVFTAGVPHNVSKKKTWFGYWRNDGFVKTKHLGRIDQFDRWLDTRRSWVDGFRNREIEPGLSVSANVTAEDEWCAEAYMETDYSTITREEFEREVKHYLMFRVLHGGNGGPPKQKRPLMLLSDIFSVSYGNKFDLNKMTRRLPCEGGVNFVGRSSKNLGVTATVAPVSGAATYPAGTITVSLGGTKLLSAFIQDAPFYTAQNVAVLSPKVELTFEQKLFVCIAIRHNRFRYSAFGREANRTIKTIEVPDLVDFPGWIGDAFGAAKETFLARLAPPPTHQFEPVAPPATLGAERVPLHTLFDPIYGSNLELNKLTLDDDGINFVSRTALNNGISAKVQRIDGLEPIDGGVLTVAGGGSVLATFLQTEPFYSGRDLYYLKPKFEFTIDELLFYCACIQANMFRYSYGRQANRTLRDLLLPARSSIPAWVYGKTGSVSEQIEQKVRD
ncbi:N-6 DNA methylase [Caulobacter sp. BP25]|uniref:N-6 DNA methylase n=1 Tax=Caulobacter sp. BP25 TaxID=2048900 RepID=UPI000C12DAD5|nr:N-6 DNA methylase [Caulobacter sp. BP25]PHY17227.1 hypothetical protein CSW59_19545 [Caulobacter sp. BP25]